MSMTNEEAIIIVGNMPIYGDECYSIPQYQEAKAMAIEALKQPRCEECLCCHEWAKNHVKGDWIQLPTRLTDVLCEDLVSNTIDASKIKIKPIAFYTGESMNTNLRMLKDLDAEQLYDKMVWLFQDYGKRFTDSKASIIEWLNSEVEKNETYN